MAGMGYLFSMPTVLGRVARSAVARLLRAVLAGQRACVVVQNREDAAQVRGLGIVDDRAVRVIRGSGVDPAKFRVGTRSLSQTCRVLMATRLLWDKGVAEFVSAAAQLHEGGADVEFLLAGAIDLGNPGSLSEADVRAISDAGHVKVVGHCEDMAGLMADVDMVVLPTRYREGVPRVLIEAGAAYLPVVSSDNTGCLELVEDGVNGVVVPQGNVEALASGMSRLIRDPDLRVRMGAEGRRRVEQDFSASVVVERTLDVYSELGVDVAVGAGSAAPASPR
jgi:glycosyltransferase involved in cell wall biosynthesis